MAAFISHSMKDKGSYSTLRAALQGQGIPCWDPEEMSAGSSLRDQLREAIDKCDVCIFMATKNSIESDWCMAEVGAFWGSAKKVIVFMSDYDINEASLPPHLQGDLRAENFEHLVKSAKKLIFEAEERRRLDAARRPRLVSEMTIATLYDVLTSLRSKSSDGLPPRDAMRLIQRNVSDNLADAEAVVPQLIAHLIGVPQEIIEVTAARNWPVLFNLTTDTGTWLGYAMSLIDRPLVAGYSNCLLVLCNAAQQCVAATAASAVIEQDKKIFCEGIVASAGSPTLGVPTELSAREGA